MYHIRFYSFKSISNLAFFFLHFAAGHIVSVSQSQNIGGGHSSGQTGHWLHPGGKYAGSSAGSFACTTGGSTAGSNGQWHTDSGQQFRSGHLNRQMGTIIPSEFSRASATVHEIAKANKIIAKNFMFKRIKILQRVSKVWSNWYHFRRAAGLLYAISSINKDMNRRHKVYILVLF